MRPPLQVLLIEDDEVDYEMVRRLLSKVDLRLNLSHADTAAKARATLRKGAVDCLIVDYGLPDANGVELVEEINQEFGDDAPPAVMLTGTGDERLAVEAMKKGVYDYLTKNYASANELEQAILGAINQRANVRREREKAMRLEQDAFSDELTGIANRRYFDIVLNDALTANGKDVDPLCVILLDLDDFKTINDTMGHAAGDMVLHETARRLERVVRAGDLAARLGGDEFVILARSDVSNASVEGFVRRLRDQLSKPIPTAPGQHAVVGVSVGTAFVPDDGVTADGLLRAADRRMYSNKVLRRRMPIPADEMSRIAELESYGVLDTNSDKGLDQITKLACKTLGVPVALVSLVDRNRQWFKSKAGIDVQETSREVAFCAHTICEDDVMVVTDALTDDRFCDNPLVTEDPAIRFYAGAPLRSPNGYNLGTLCVIDGKPRQLSDQQRLALIGLADLVMRELNARREQRLKDVQ